MRCLAGASLGDLLHVFGARWRAPHLSPVCVLPAVVLGCWLGKSALPSLE